MNSYTRDLHASETEKVKGKRKKQRDAEFRINLEIRVALKHLEGDHRRRTAFRNLVACVQSRTKFLKPTFGEGSPAWTAAVFLIRRLKNLAARQGHWLRPCDTWHPSGGNLRPLFRSLARHLLTVYPVPGFMDCVWDLPLGPEGFQQQSWYIRLGRGASLRELRLPSVLTRKMEHYVRHAPDHYTVVQAIRYGEVRGLGGSEKLAREVVLGKLGERLHHSEFWRTILLFFATHGELDIEHVNPIIDFIDYNKFAGEEVLSAHGAISRPAPWPEFSIKGRSVRSLMRLVEAWHGDLANTTPRENFWWHPSGIQGYRFLERRPGEEHDLDWSIHEILDTTALHTEGQAMHHCVYGYASKCRRRETTIWSLRLRLREQEKRMATIEVDPRRRSIVQVRTRFNHRPGVRSREIIRRWTEWAGLNVECRL